jgi:hypothetical protein
VRLTEQPEVVTSGCLSIVVIIKFTTTKLINKAVVNREHLSTWLIVGKLGQGMRCCKCNSNSNALVCETHKHTLSESGLSLCVRIEERV